MHRFSFEVRNQNSYPSVYSAWRSPRYASHLFPITFPQVKHRTGMIIAMAFDSQLDLFWFLYGDANFVYTQECVRRTRCWKECCYWRRHYSHCSRETSGLRSEISLDYAKVSFYSCFCLMNDKSCIPIFTTNTQYLMTYAIDFEHLQRYRNVPNDRMTP